MLQAQSLIGLIVIPLLAWFLSERRRDLRALATLRFIVVAVLIQAVIAGVMLNVPPIRALFDYPGHAVAALQAATTKGVELVFGYLAGGQQPFEVTNPQRSYVLAFQALPLILLISVLSRLLYHWGILQRVVGAFAWALRKTLGVSGPLGTASAANIFVGMVEAPLFIRPYLVSMTRAQLFAMMTVGMSTVAGTVLALYASLLSPVLPQAAGHLIVASVISVPAALLIALLMVPEPVPTNAAPSQDLDNDLSFSDENAPRSAMDAITQGTREGVSLLVSVAAMLIVAVALVSLVNMILSAVSQPFGRTLTLEEIFGWVFAGFAWIIGIPWAESLTAGSLLGVKTIVNEFVAYLSLGGLPEGALSPRSRLILTYALCGFANLGSLGIMIGGLSAMAPERRNEIVDLGARTVVSGTFATLMTAAVVGAMTPA